MPPERNTSKSTGTERVSEEFATVKDDLNALRQDVQALLSALGSEKEQKMSDIRDRLCERAENIKRHMQHAAKYCGKAGEKVCQRMSEHPVKSVLIALAAGAVVGRLLGRNRG
jgi:ElaB/YqjD/DUF883 family membrane-anchored ribosome-binding protein